MQEIDYLFFCDIKLCVTDIKTFILPISSQTRNDVFALSALVPNESELWNGSIAEFIYCSDDGKLSFVVYIRGLGGSFDSEVFCEWIGE